MLLSCAVLSRSRGDRGAGDYLTDSAPNQANFGKDFASIAAVVSPKPNRLDRPDNVIESRPVIAHKIHVPQAKESECEKSWKI